MHAHTNMSLPLDRINLLLSLRAYNKTWCDQIVYSYTKAYHSNEGGDTWTMQTKLVFTVVLMALMGFILYIKGFLRMFVPCFSFTPHLFLGRYNLGPMVRFLLHFAFFQFIPLLSSVFSLAEGPGGTNLLLILLWMLLVELIRTKVRGMMLPTDGSSFSRGIGRFTLTDYSEEASRLVWIGYLIYSTLGNMRSHSLDAVFIILWSLGLVKLVQNVVNTWLASGSWHTAKNPLLVAGYMQLVMEKEENHPTAVSTMDMSKCKFVVMGEDMLVMSKNDERKTRPTTTHGYGYGVGQRVAPASFHPNKQAQAPYCDHNEQKHIHLLLDPDKMEDLDTNKMEEKRLVTVGQIWDLHKQEKFKTLFSGRRRQRLEDLCLSFSLFKMLRRRFEHYPMVEVGSEMARKVMLEGLLNLEGDEHSDRSHRPFRVLQLELEFLKNYYQQAAAPVVMSQPKLFFCNFAFSVIFFLVFFAAISYILVRNRDAAILYCVTMGFASNPLHFLSLYLYLSITILLALAVMTIEAYDFWTLYVLSDWNIVRLICIYSFHRPLLQKFFFSFIAVRFCAFSAFPCLTRSKIKIHQVSILDAHDVPDMFSTRATYMVLPKGAKQHIIRTLKGCVNPDDGIGIVLTNATSKAVDPNTGIVRLPRLKGLDVDAKTTTSTEIILACHLATELFECDRKAQDQLGQQHQAVASALSRYCMYLVARMPQLLPDEETWVSDRYKDARSCLKTTLSKTRWGGIICPRNHQILLEEEEEDVHDPMTRRGVKLFHKLKRQAKDQSIDAIWKDLANFWVRFLIYLAPSNDVQGHARVLASWGGGDLMTCLWAFCTHAGITRQPLELNDDEHKDDLV